MERGQRAFDERTVPQYITTRVRQADTADGVLVGSFHGISSLEIYEELDGSTYITRIYCYEGYLRELFCEESAEMLPEDGEPIVEAENVMFWQALHYNTSPAFGEEGFCFLKGKNRPVAS